MKVHSFLANRFLRCQGKSLFFYSIIVYVIEKQLNKLGASPQLEWWNGRLRHSSLWLRRLNWNIGKMGLGILQYWVNG
jgi:hypothetical protein